jgi:pimeloyl-ACP methyl ester carboxylesterase
VRSSWAGSSAGRRAGIRTPPGRPGTPQYDAVLKWGTPNYSLLQRLNAITQPVFIANGDNDRMILPWYSHLVASLIPDAFVKLYPDAAHGFLFQHAEEFAGDVLKFLDS